MSSRYQTLNVSINSMDRNNRRLNRTIDIGQTVHQQQDSQDNNQKVNRFKQLYFKNQKLRKELKALNQKLNQKLQKLKLPNVKKKAMSVDLNHNPPSKAQQRQLENAYKQINLYKKQIYQLKINQQSVQNYQKMRKLENMITYTDKQIENVLQQIKSIKNVKKIQDKAMNQDIQNSQLRQRALLYDKQKKSFKQKVKELQKKSRKRQQQFMKQQQYLVKLEAKARTYAHGIPEQKPVQRSMGVDNRQYTQALQQVAKAKQFHEQQSKKIEQKKKYIKNTKAQRIKADETYTQKVQQHKKLQLKVESFTRLLKDLQLKKYEQTGVRPQNQNNMLRLQEVEEDNQDQPNDIDELVESNPIYKQILKSQNSKKNMKSNHESKKNSSIYNQSKPKSNSPSNLQSKKNSSIYYQQNKQKSNSPSNIQSKKNSISYHQSKKNSNSPSNYQSKKNSHSPSNYQSKKNSQSYYQSQDRSLNSNISKIRKVSKGYSTPTDQVFKQSGKIIGLKVFFDQTKYICGLSAFVQLQNQKKVQTKIFGNVTDSQLKWQAQNDDNLIKIKGSFTDQGYLAQLSLVSKNKKIARFGNSSNNPFQFQVDDEQKFSGIFGCIRRLGQDVRITEIGFWISKQ